jgi:hypothetical protein
VFHEFMVAFAQFFRNPYVHVSGGSGVVHDHTSVVGSWVIAITGQFGAEPWLGFATGKSPGWYWLGSRPADVVVVVRAASERYHSPRISTFVVAGLPS